MSVTKRATSKPTKPTSRQRRARRSNCSRISRRRLRFCDLSRNSIAAQRMRLKRIRLIKWMMIGTLMSRIPAIISHGLRNALNAAVNQEPMSNMTGGPPRGDYRHAVVQELGQDGVKVVAGSGQLV